MAVNWTSHTYTKRHRVISRKHTVKKEKNSASATQFNKIKYTHVTCCCLFSAENDQLVKLGKGKKMPEVKIVLRRFCDIRHATSQD